MNIMQKPGLENLVKFEMAGAIEHWGFVGDEVHMILPHAVRCICRELHYWYVNFEGKTRCVSCHEDYRREYDARRTSGIRRSLSVTAEARA